jgi:hypothetical protein
MGKMRPHLSAAEPKDNSDQGRGTGSRPLATYLSYLSTEVATVSPHPLPGTGFPNRGRQLPCWSIMWCPNDRSGGRGKSKPPDSGVSEPVRRHRFERQEQRSLPWERPVVVTR